MRQSNCLLTRSSKQVITRGSKQKRPETHARDMVWNMQTGKYEPAPDPIQFASTNPSYALVRGKVQQRFVSELSDAVKDTTLEDLLDEERSLKEELKSRQNLLDTYSGLSLSVPAYVQRFTDSLPSYVPGKFSIHDQLANVSTIDSDPFAWNSSGNYS